MRHRKRRGLAAVVSAALGILLATGFDSGPASGQPARTPTAIVEDIPTGAPSVPLLGLLEPGRVVELAAADRVVLGYLTSCRREEIAGPGRVVVGTEGSRLEGASLIASDVVACQGRPAATRHGMESGAAARLRSVDTGGLPAVADGRPLFLVDDPALLLSIHSLDRDDVVRLLPGRTSLIGSRASDTPLLPGRYRAQRGARVLEFRVLPSEGRGPVRPLERLLRF